ncbi:MAG TPA: xanthine dehydrogenase family protein molybdopterin-binding subunit [Candidatus Acidoferrales bacterium]|nr:xanthine dehydrogenase family protein molybdopterin-binding subunit [Candidatus Acidoferrales bacterium]
MSYLADLELEGCLELAFVRSPYPHAEIGRIGAPALGARDLGLRPLVVEGRGLEARPWHPLPADRARYPGEAVAVVFAEDRYRAEDLAEQAEVELRPLEPEPPRRLFEADFESGEAGSVDACFARAAHIVEETFQAARQTPLPLECRGVAASFEGGRLTVWTSTQVPHLVRRGLARSLGLEEAAVRVLVPEVGGGFGLKAHLFAEELVAAALARRLGRPVRWLEDRRENLIASAHAHDTRVRLRAAFAAGGRLLAGDAEVTADAGAYSIYPFSASLEPMTCAATLFGPYSLEALRYRATGLSSHRCPVGAYRGVGMNAAVFATERLLDLAAAELGIDPLELRRRSAVTGFPLTTPAGRRLDSGDYLGLLRLLEPTYRRLRTQQRQARARGRLFGVGVCLFNEHSGTGGADYRRRGLTTLSGQDASRVRVLEGGRVQVSTSAASAGQGHAESYRAVAARELGLRPEQVDVVEGDTDLCPEGSGTFASRGAVGVLDSLVAALRVAAEQDLQPGTDVTRTADPTQVFPSGAHLAAVEVDPGTFHARVTRYLAVEDCGTPVEPRVVEGQVRGGVAMGIGNVLFERCAYDAGGQPLTASLLDYLVPLATDVPEVEMEHLESPSPATLLGSKGVGEAGTIGAWGAVANAVADAVAPLGARLTELPLRPGTIFAALGENVPSGASGDELDKARPSPSRPRKGWRDEERI